MTDIHIDVSSEAYMARTAIQEAANSIACEMTRPSVLYRPMLTADGTMWCVLLGSDLQEGVSGFGETPDAAMRAFDEAFLGQRTPAAVLASPSTGEAA